MRSVAYGAVLLLLQLLPAVTFAEPPARSVLLLDQSAPHSPFSQRFGAKLNAELSAWPGESVEVFAESLDLRRFGQPRYEEMLQLWLLEKYVEQPIGVIIAVGEDALRHALGLRREMRPEPAVVFLRFDAAPRNLPARAYGLIAPLRFDNLIKSARMLVPDLGQIVLAGQPLDQQPARRHYLTELPKSTSGLEVVDLTGFAMDEVQARVSSLSSNAVVVYTAIRSRRVDNTNWPWGLKSISEASNRPVVVDVDAVIGAGAAGGYVLNAEALATALAQMAFAVLEGRESTLLPVNEADMAKPMFDWRQLQRFGIDERSLPPDSTLMFRELRVWETNPGGVIAMLATILAQAIVIAWLLIEHRRRRRAEVESRRYLTEISQMDRAVTVGALSSAFTHELNQPLGAILSNAEAAVMLLEQKSPDLAQVREILADICNDERRASEIITRLRALLKKSDLRTQDVNVNTVVAAVLRIIEPEAKRRGIVLGEDKPPADLIVCADPVHLQQVILNLAVNAMEAMDGVTGPRLLTVRSSQVAEAGVVISVADTGIGIAESDLNAIFDPHFSKKAEGTGLGLFIASMIVQAYDGRIWAENRPGGGAVLKFVLPLRSGETRVTQPTQLAPVQPVVQELAGRAA